MAKKDDPQAEEALTPLRVIGQQGAANAEDRQLARGLQELFPDAPLAGAPQEGWAAIEQEALRYARAQRRRYLLRELVAGAMPSLPIFRAVGAGAFLIALCLLGGPQKSPPPAHSQRITRAIATLSHEGGAPRDLLLLNGAEVLLTDGRAEIEQGDPSQTRVALHSGTVRLTVPRLVGPRRLAVATLDTEVIVHGTRFEVRKLGSATQVIVHEGLVEVRPVGGARPSVFLRPGERITVPSLQAYLSAAARRIGELARDLRCDDSEHEVDSFLAAAPADIDVSAALYLRGACSVRRGAPNEAIVSFEQAASRSQDLVRADNALARAAQLRAGRDPAEGTAAWVQYLRRFPAGLHRAMARRYLADGRP